MHTNLDHDIFSKKSRSLALEAEVEEFLKKNGKLEATQIPFGHSSYIEPTFSIERTAQTTMRNIMSNSINADPDLAFTRKNRNEAHDKGLKVFIGRCKKHGETHFSIKLKKGSLSQICRKCIKEYSASQNLKRKLKKDKTC